MSRQEYERQALDIVAGRTGKKQAAKPAMSGIAIVSIWLWIAAIVVIGAIVGYVFLWK
jgi:hypothetical protein